MKALLKIGVWGRVWGSVGCFVVCIYKAVFTSIKKCTMQKKKDFSSHQTCRYMHGVLNVDKIKN
jgi:hypothetical protein